jgi:hypothetical protein
MKEWKRTDVKGLSIINHQRHVPALERQFPFRADLITNAEEHEFGLLTTWDLFRLVRGYLENNWKPEQVKPLFYKNGHIEPIPTHYELLGVIEHFWPNSKAVMEQVGTGELAGIETHLTADQAKEGTRVFRVRE